MGSPSISADVAPINAYDNLGSIQFNGIDDYLLLKNPVSSPPTTDFTFTLWLKTTDVGADDDRPWNGKGILWADIGGGANDMIPMALVGKRLSFGTGGGSNGDHHIVSAHDISTGEWVHVAVTRSVVDGVETKRVYVNGLLSSDDTNDSTVVLSANDRLAIGGNPLDGYFINANIDDVRFYAAELSAEEIAQIAQGSLR